MDEEEKKMRELAAEADDKEESYYRKAMERKDKESQILRLSEGIPSGKPPTVTMEEVEKSVKKRKAPFMHREDYQVGETDSLTKAEKLEYPNASKFPQRLKREQSLAKEYDALARLRGRAYPDIYGSVDKGYEGYDIPAFDKLRGKSDEVVGFPAMLRFRNEWDVMRRLVRSPEALAHDDYLEFAEEMVKELRDSKENYEYIIERDKKKK